MRSIQRGSQWSTGWRAEEGHRKYHLGLIGDREETLMGLSRAREEKIGHVMVKCVADKRS